MAHIPLRMCIACRERRPERELLRVTVDKASGRAVPDTGRVKEGRGAYICRDPACLKRAARKRGFERHLKTAASEELYSRLEEML